MPSQEDYLNELLNGMPGKDGTARNDVQAPDLEDLEDMSEEQIARLLEEGKAGSPSYAGEAAEDVLDMAGGSGDSDLEEIQDLLRKSDRNETVDVQDDFRKDESPADRLLQDIERAGEAEVEEKAADTKTQKALEKKRLKAEKKAAREAAKAEKREKHRDRKKSTAHTKRKASVQKQEWEEIPEYDTLADKELLDSIVSEAGKVEHAEPESSPNLLELAASLEAERNIDPSQEIPYFNEDSSSETDLDSGILALEPDEIDEFIPDISETGREEATPKKKGMVSRFVDFLMEEEEEEEKENEDVQISDENQEIIREMDNEEAEKAKKKTQKKAKKKDAKKDKKKKEQKPKKAKPPKQKKEKKPKEEDPYPGRKLSFKKAFPVVLLGISVGAAVFILVHLSADFSGKQTAKNAFEASDYQTCYVNLHGKSLNETEEQMYNKSQCILHIRMWYREYEMLEADGNEAKALDSLIQSVHEYPSLFVYAIRWDAQNEVNEVYLNILDILRDKYGVTEEQAQKIGAMKSDIEYTRAVMALVGDAGYGQESTLEEAPVQPGSQDSPEGAAEAQPDELPEEAEMEPGEYVDNQG
ncbi:MAG TPA: hypothetical protein DCZ91_05095 [Lachnospiraceae bacterium]|nr:hypothetical protein [Lachnospiraceae bacterium]